MRLDRCTADTDAQIIHPRPEHFDFDLVLPGQRDERFLVQRITKLRHGREAFGRTAKNLLTLRGQCGEHGADITKRNVRSSRGNQPGIFPNRKIVCVPIPCVGR